MILRAIAEFGFDASRSHMIGDSATDAAAGEASGCVTHVIDPSDPNAFLRAVDVVVRA
jgi:histidinol phosphatase-like enzyme